MSHACPTLVPKVSHASGVSPCSFHLIFHQIPCKIRNVESQSVAHVMYYFWPKPQVNRLWGRRFTSFRGFPVATAQFPAVRVQFPTVPGRFSVVPRRCCVVPCGSPWAFCSSRRVFVQFPRRGCAVPGGAKVTAKVQIQSATLSLWTAHDQIEKRMTKLKERRSRNGAALFLRLGTAIYLTGS